MSHSERDETMAAQARIARVQAFIEELMREGLTFEEVVVLLHRGVAAAESYQRHEGGQQP